MCLIRLSGRVQKVLDCAGPAVILIKAEGLVMARDLPDFRRRGTHLLERSRPVGNNMEQPLSH